MNKEIWKDIPDYDGLYQVSNFGRIAAHRKNVRFGCSGEKTRIIPWRILSTFPNKQGYMRINLFKDGKTKQFQVHRLVAMAFIPNPDNLPVINHKDENPHNNHVENLEWCTPKYNANYGTRNARCSAKNYNNPKVSKPIVQYSEHWEIVNLWPSTKEAIRQLKLNERNLHTALKNPKRFCSGFHWKYLCLPPSYNGDKQ